MTSSALGFKLRHLVFYGPGRETAAVNFGSGLNAIYGASDTGKSFIVEAIDFMLGGKPPLRDIPERVGYDRVLLGIETLDGEMFTFIRSTEGGLFQLFGGLHEVPPEGGESRDLNEKHSDKSDANLSSFLLAKCSLLDKRIRKNKRGETNSLSFRYLARLLIVNEAEIIRQGSPLSDGNPTADTPNFATFKLMLTGVDDSALSTRNEVPAEDESREAQLDLLDDLLEEYRARLKELTDTPRGLEDQLARVDETLTRHSHALGATEADYRQLINRRRELRKKVEAGQDRRVEINELLERFALLSSHYVSDVSRLQGIEEGGTLFRILGLNVCPLCGADPEHHNKDRECDGNIEAVIVAARTESSKIALLQSELHDTIASLEKEARGIDSRLPRVQKRLEGLSNEIDELVGPKLTKLRSTYSGLVDKRGEIREGLSLQQTIENAAARREALLKSLDDETDATISDGDLPTSVANAFAKQFAKLLHEWHFPAADGVHFDPKFRDLVIDGKLRFARGKGLRAITYAAFTISLMDYCREHSLPHPGFVVLDSPLLSYKEPEGVEDDLRGTDLKDKFYEYLASHFGDRQVIIFENEPPSEEIAKLPHIEKFTKNPHVGRYGFFPLRPSGSFT
jgi:hypothetical protein